MPSRCKERRRPSLPQQCSTCPDMGVNCTLSLPHSASIDSSIIQDRSRRIGHIHKAHTVRMHMHVIWANGNLLVTQEIGTTWPLGVSLGAEQLQFLTPAVHCAEADAYAAVVAPSATSAGGAAHNGAAAAGNGVAAAANELWMWTSASSHSTLIRNATRHQLPRGTVVGLHPVGPATTYVDPGPVEAARLRGARATSMAKASGTLGNDSLNLPSPEAAAADARPSVGAAPGALGFALVFADASLVHIAAPSATRTMDQAVVVTQLPAPEAAGRLVLASAHSGSALVVIVAEPKSASTAVCLYTAEV